MLTLMETYCCYVMAFDMLLKATFADLKKYVYLVSLHEKAVQQSHIMFTLHVYIIYVINVDREKALKHEIKV